MITCSRCKVTKASNLFSKSTEKGHQNWCKQCVAENKDIWRAKNPEKVRWNRIWHMYRLRQSDYEAMIAKQNGICTICESAPATNVDHDHKCCSGSRSCGKCVRDIICTKCNIAVGHVESVNIEKILAYIARHNGN